MFQGIIYKTTNLINGKIYIGQTTKENSNYLGSGVYFEKALKKYGKENFKRETLEYCETQGYLNSNEEYYIELYNSTNPNIGYNLSKGGGSGNNGYKYPEEVKKRMRNKKFSQETREKMKKAALGNKRAVGFKHSNQAIEKIRKANIGRKFSKEHNKNLSNSLKGKKYNCIKYKLSKEQVQEIINLLKTTQLTQTKIGKIFNISQTEISNIKINKSIYLKFYKIIY